MSCHRFLSKRNGSMSLGQISGILDSIAKLPQPLTEIIPVNYGELFTRDDWHKILCLINHKLPNTGIVIPTNGALITEQVAIALTKIPSIRVINFSINAYFDETYEAFNGLDAKNIPQIRKAISILKIMRQDIVLNASMVFDPMYSSDLEKDLFVKQWISCANPQILPAASAGRPAKKSQIQTLLPCRSIFSDLVIGFDGKLSSCCFDSAFQIYLGEYTGDIIKDWHNEQLTSLRTLHNQHRRNEINLCGRCSFS